MVRIRRIVNEDFWEGPSRRGGFAKSRRGRYLSFVGWLPSCFVYRSTMDFLFFLKKKEIHGTPIYATTPRLAIATLSCWKDWTWRPPRRPDEAPRPLPKI